MVNSAADISVRTGLLAAPKARAATVLSVAVALEAGYLYLLTLGDFAQQIPPIVAPVLLFSLVESKFVKLLYYLRVAHGRRAFGQEF